MEVYQSVCHEILYRHVYHLITAPRCGPPGYAVNQHYLTGVYVMCTFLPVLLWILGHT